MVQRAAVLYPLLDETVDTGAGIDVRRLKDTYVSSSTPTSVQNNAQGTNSERRFDPATAIDMTVINAATTNDAKGWSFSTADMAVVDAVCVPFLAAQTLTVNYDGQATGTGSGAVGAQDIFTPRASLWKYNTSTNTATLIVGDSGTAVVFNAVTPYTGTVYAASVVLSVPETTFGANEVLMVVIGGNLACGAGLLGAARTFIVRYNHNQGAEANITFSGAPASENGMRNSCSISQNLTAEGVVTRGILDIAELESVIAEGVVSSSKAVVASKFTDIVAEGVVSSSKLVEAQRNIDVVGEGVVTRNELDIVRAHDNIIAEGVVTYTKVVIAEKSFNLTAEGVVTLLKELNIERSVIGEGDVTLIKATQAQRAFSLIAEGKIAARVELDYDEIPTEGGSGPSQTYVFGIME